VARKIKRLSERWDSRDLHEVIQEDSSEDWSEAFAWWQHAGVAAETLLAVLEKIRVERMRYEEELQGRDTRARNIREAQKALKEAASLIRFLKTQESLNDDGSRELVFGQLGEQIERAVQSYIDNLSRIVPRGRPSDLWLGQCVGLLAIELMSGPLPKARARPRGVVRQSEKSTIRAIAHVLNLAGHGELVTREKIRHVIRKIRPAIEKRREGRMKAKV